MRTRQSHYGPACPVCHEPLATHVVTGYRPKDDRLKVRNGWTSKTCFEVLSR